MLPLLLTAADALAVNVCGLCYYQTVQEAIDDPAVNVATLLDPTVTEPFRVPSGRTFTVVGTYAYTTLSPDSESAPMVIVDAGGVLTLEDVIVLGNSTTSVEVDGGSLVANWVIWLDAKPGIEVDDGGSVELHSCTMTGGYASEGAAITATNGAVVSIDGSVLDGNYAHDGDGGAIVARDATLAITSTYLDFNYANGRGGAIHAERSAVSVDTTTVYANAGVEGAGLSLVEGSLTMTASDVSWNSETVFLGRGGGLLLERTPTTIDASFVQGNSAGYGAGLYALDADVVLTATSVASNDPYYGNEACWSGGGAFVEGGSLTATDSYFQWNYCWEGGNLVAWAAPITLTGGAVDAGWAYGEYGNADGGGILVEPFGTSPTIRLDGVAAYGNWANTSGGLLRVRGSGAAVVELDDVASAWNYAGGDGGSIAMDRGSLEVTDSQFDGDWAGWSGGSIFVANATGPVTIGTSSFSNAVADEGGAVHVDFSPSLDVTESTFTSTTGYTAGGAMMVHSVAVATLHDCTFESTSSNGTGGAVHVYESDDVTVTGSTFCAADAIGGFGDPGLGGALSFEKSCDGGATCVVESVLVADAQAKRGSVLQVNGSDVAVLNATILGADTTRGDGGAAFVTGDGELELDGSIVIATAGYGVVAENGGSATVGEIVVDDAGTAGFTGTRPDDDVTVTGAIRRESVQLLVVPDPQMREDLPCAQESRIHPQYGLYQAFAGTDFGAYGGAGQVAWWRGEDLDQDGAPWVYDCDDREGAVSGLHVEVCGNTIDDDCDGAVDDADATAGIDWYRDADGDGHVAAEPSPLEGGGTWEGCAPPDAGWTRAPGGDCDDAVPEIHPGADEYCNTLDDDCDGAIDEDAVDAESWLVDDDEDGFGVRVTSCEGGGPVRDDLVEGDCDDGRANVHPGATEVDGDGIDQDCELGDASAFVAGGACGCDASGGSPIAFGLLLVTTVALQRSPHGLRPCNRRRSACRSSKKGRRSTAS